MKKYVVELIGTFFLVLTVGGAVIGGAGALAPVAIGSALMVMIFAGGHISGAHYNPAVTLGACLRGACSWADAPGYVIAQLVGGAAAAGIIGGVFGLSNAEAATLSVGPTIIAEIIGTFALVYVILNVATAKANDGNSFYGLAIGFTVTAMAYTLGGISGGAFNPAVALGAGMMNLVSLSDIWMHIVGNLVGGALAAFVFLFVNGTE